jgi:hypothetical protein
MKASIVLVLAMALVALCKKDEKEEVSNRTIRIAVVQ